MAVDGLVLTCALDGRLCSVHPVGQGLPDLHLRPGRPFSMLFGPDSVGRALDLFTVLRRGGVVLDRRVDAMPEAAGPLYVSGRRDGDGLVLSLAMAPGAVSRVALGVAVGNPALAARLEPLGQAPLSARLPSGDALFDEITRLNGELTTAQRALAKANAELAASNEQKNRLLGMLAHDLRSPLQVVAGFAQVLEERLDPNLGEVERSCLERIRESSLFMRHLVEDALSLAAVQAGRLRLTRRPTDVAALVRRNVATNAILAQGKGIALALTAADGLPAAAIDPAKVEQVLNNLLANAIKYSDRGASIRIGVEMEGDRLRLRVADSGRGIPEAMRDRLFQPFARSGTPGTAGETTVGLGLYICRTIVEGHGGSIHVDSDPGRGCTVTVELPLRTAEP